MPINKHLVGAMTAVVLAVALWSVPVNASVHEIVAQWCSGQEELNPPGISDDTKRTFAQPLVATGVLRQTIVPDLGILVTFDYDHPAVKVQSSGIVLRIGTAPDGTPIFLDVPEPDPDFPAFRRCPRLAGF